MSTLNVDKVDPSTGTALEIGSSGDTITIPSGATIVNSGTATGFGAALTGSTNNTVVTVTAANAISGEANLTFDGTNLDLPDNIKERFGTGNDLEIYHDASDSYISDTGTGALIIKGSVIRLQSTGGADQVYITGGAATSLQYNGSTKLDTTSGGVDITGAISKDSGSFRIKHPLEAKKNTHHLVHSFVESPRADLIYRGKATLSSGSATVNIDTAVGMSEGTFVALCDDVQCFTTNESNWDLVKASVNGNTLTIESQNSDSTAEISWLIIGDRKDEHIMNTDWTDENGKPIIEPLQENA
jgi:hypothetical protein